MATIARMAVALTMDSADFERGISNVQRQTESFSKKLGNIGKTMSLAVTAPLVGIAGVAVKSAADFEQSMNIMQQVAGATGDEMEKMQKQALKLGAETAFSAGEAADAMLELAKAGMKPMQVMEAIPGVLDLAAAGGLGLAEAAGVTTAALNAFNMAASESGNVANMLAAAANASASDVTDLGAAVQQGGFAFAAAGQELDDLVASTAILSNVGLTGSDAGTALKNAMMRLMNPTKEAADMMATLGINVYDTQGNMLDWADVIDEVDRATAGLTDEARNAALGTIFMSDGMKAMIPLLDEGKAGFLDMRRAINVQGSAANTANARMKGFAGAVEYLKGSVDSFMIEAALPFLDSLSGIVRQLADLITMVSELPAPVRNTAIAIGAVLAAAGPLMVIVSQMLPAFKLLGVGLAALTSPVGLVIAAVAALGAAFATDFMGIRTTVMKVLQPVIDGFDAFRNYIQLVVSDGDVLNDWLTHLPDGIQPAVQGLGEMVLELKKWIDLAAAGDFSGLFGAMGAALDRVRIAVSEFDWGDYIQDRITDWGDFITSLDWDSFITHLNSWRSFITDTITDWATYVTSLDWGGFITKLADWGAFVTDTLDDWGVYATVLDWGKYITATLTDWATYVTSLDWGGYITTTLDWATYVSVLVWDDYIKPLWDDYIKPLVWDNFLVKLDWKAIGLTAVDWAMWIPAIMWTAFITPVRWVTYIAALVWNAIIDPLFWNDFIPTLISWSEYLSKINWSQVLNPLSWGVYIATLDWGKYLPVKFAWNSFIEKVDWLNHIPGLTWPTFNAPDWSDFIDKLKWPKIPSFPGWEAIARGLFGWGAKTSTGNQIYRPDSWGATSSRPVGSGGGYPTDVNGPAPQVYIDPVTGEVKPYASGGRAQGWAVVGEKGPELAYFGGAGAEILSNGNSLNLLQALGIPGFADGTGPVPPIGPRLSPPNRPIPPIGPQMVQAITDASDGMAAAAESIAESATVMGEASESLRSALQSVPGLFGTSDVTADQMRLAEMGVPQDLADNYLRRLTDEVINGVDWEGVDIQDAAARAGIDPSLPSEVILELFKQAWNDSSLFANPENLDLIDQGAVKAAIKKQQDQLAGQMNILQLFGITDEGLQQQVTGLGEALSSSFLTEFTPTLFEPVGTKMIESMAGGFGDTTAASTASGNMITAIEASTATADMQNKLADAGESAASAYWGGWQTFFKTAQIPVPTPPGGAPLPGMATGGPVSRGVPYIIGERGPEMFIPNRSGQIIPNDELGGIWDMSSIGGAAVNIEHVSVNNEIDIKELAYQVAGYLNRRR